MRSLARDLGERIGCGGALARLRRTAALGFQLAQAIGLEQLPQRPALHPPLAALDHLPRQRLSASEWQSWCCGRRLGDSAGLAADQAVAMLAPSGALAGVGRADGQGWIQPRLVFAAAG